MVSQPLCPHARRFFGCQELVCRVADALPTLRDVSAFQRIDRSAFNKTSQKLWRRIPSLFPLLHLFTSLERTGRFLLVLKGPLLDSEVQRFHHYACHVVLISVLYDTVSDEQRHLPDLHAAFELIVKHSPSMFPNAVLFPKLKVIGISPTIPTDNILWMSRAFHVNRLSCLMLSINQSDVPHASSILRVCGGTLCQLALTGTHILDHDVCESINQLSGLEDLFLDMDLIFEDWTSEDTVTWNEFVTLLPRTLNTLHMLCPPATPSIIRALSGRHMHYTFVQTDDESFCAYLAAIDDTDTPLFLQISGNAPPAGALGKVIRLVGINMYVKVIGNSFAVLHRKGCHLKKPHAACTRHGVLKALDKWLQVNQMYMEMWAADTMLLGIVE
ncbi:hypothetical protein BJ165DRAFT_1534596 [Panaeolus papilionaceus]|nr:hypothetical protein BJ165DRAFT_1534596 [Panaeolus papilionaceus]